MLLQSCGGTSFTGSGANKISAPSVKKAEENEKVTSKEGDAVSSSEPGTQKSNVISSESSVASIKGIEQTIEQDSPQKVVDEEPAQVLADSYFQLQLSAPESGSEDSNVSSTFLALGSIENPSLTNILSFLILILS